MRYCYITFRSVTFAQRAERLLKNTGRECSLLRTPRVLAQRGCGYCLRLRLQDAAQTAELLHNAGLSYGKIYALLDGGSFEELLV